MEDGGTSVPEKANEPMYVTLVGIVADESEEHDLKAQEPNDSS